MCSHLWISFNYLFSLKNSPPCQDLNPGPPQYLADMLPTELSLLGLFTLIKKLEWGLKIITDHQLSAMLTHTRCINLRRLPALTFIQHMYANSLTQITLARALAHLKQHGLFLEGENHTT